MAVLDNTYQLANRKERLTKEEINKVLNDFEYFMSHYQQIVNKGRETVPFRLNAPQRRLCAKLLPMIAKETRLNRRHDVVVCKTRQMGISSVVVAFVNYVCAYMEGLNHLDVVHTFPVGATITKFYQQKLQPLITGIHPDLFPELDYERVSKTSIITHYDNIKGAKRDNYYELVSANASSIRSGTCHIALLDECFSGDVEILTDEGFKRFDTLNKTERVAQYDMNTQAISFVKPQRYIEKYYKGKAYEWCKNEYKFITTENHEFVVSKKGQGDYHKVKAKEMVLNENYEYPLWGKGIGNNEELTPLERLGIAVQADGCVRNIRERAHAPFYNVGWSRCRVTLKRPDKIKRLERLLQEAQLYYSKGNQNKQGKIEYRFDLPFENPKLLSSFLDINCSEHRARQIIHEILQWDGYGLDRNNYFPDDYLPHNSYYSSAIKENRDFVASIAIQAGQSVSASVQVDNRFKSVSTVYRLNITDHKETTYRSFKRKAIDYSGMVYCVTVPTGAIIVKTGTHVWICGNCGLYSNPERLEDALSPSIPAYGFSLVVYLSTFEEKSSAYFLNKIKTAMENPEDYTFIFMPWFELYPEQEFGRPLESVPLTDYDKTVIIPALEEWGVPESRWGDCIGWYHLESTRVSRMRQEYPTTIDEVLNYGSDEQYFSAETLARHREKELEVKPYKFIVDGPTHKTEFVETDVSPLKIFKHPFKGRRYMVTIDPIASVSDSSDFFAAIVWDRANNEQVARILGKDESLETWAEYLVALAKYYNQAVLCPEQNIAQSLYLVVKGLGYHRWYFKDDNARKKQEPGLRTTVGTKDPMLQRLNLMLEHDRIILHDTDTFNQLDTFMRKVKGSNNSVKFEAKKGCHDDLVSCCWVYAGTLGQADITGNKGRVYAFL